MASNRLREHRLAAEMTQTEVAEAIKVTQPTYQRWEKGAQVPPAKMKALAKLFNSTEDRLLGVNAPIVAAFYDDSAPTEHQYYGEVSFHFAAGGRPLVLSISEEARVQFSRAMMGSSYFIPIRSLTNQLVAIRRDAIADIYFCSEAHDDYGPEHETYENPSNLQYPDNRDWEIIESIVLDFGEADYDKKSLERLKRVIFGPPKEVIEQDLASGKVTQEQVDEVNKLVEKTLDEAERLSFRCVYQLSSGARRELSIESERKMYDAFSDIFDGKYIPEFGARYIQAVPYHHYLFLNPAAVDFISVPTHRYQIGLTAAEAGEDDDGDWE
ncbi:helix-turn-helix transcriptional regulator [Rhizobium sp. R339]|uniref:helix-turn-helix transcriptional regulator n=1 Tax=Rhizobium sp. R339 TaxID=1764273 RepID=UPI000B538B5E|nr:helix-turn-helix transcriptional regulator [Rhizobium sp. R339]